MTDPATIRRMGAAARRPCMHAVRATILASLLTLVMATAPSCVLVAERGGAVELTLSLDAMGGTSVDGHPVSIVAADLAVQDARLVPCERRASLIEAALIGRAHALHPDRSGNGLAAPTTLPLKDAASIGVLHPERGAYCGLELVLAPQDALDGWTLRADGVAQGAPFEARGYAMRVWRLPLDAPLVVSDDTPGAALTLHLDPADAISQVAVDAPADAIGLELLLALESGARAFR